MTSMTCPWCEEETLLELRAWTEMEATFTCPECGTSVAFEDEPGPTFQMGA